MKAMMMEEFSSDKKQIFKILQESWPNSSWIRFINSHFVVGFLVILRYF